MCRVKRFTSAAGGQNPVGQGVTPAMAISAVANLAQIPRSRGTSSQRAALSHFP